MNDKEKSSAAPGPAADWSNLWRSMAESSNRMAEAWSGSIAPFMISRASEKATGEMNDLSAAIELRRLIWSSRNHTHARLLVHQGDRCPPLRRHQPFSNPRLGRI
jgi:hypothetical protein